ncbi:MAG: bifunctional alpha,alpha-trehalose-phosphate synthase (UDP-forming)/trehalose-phosphatase [Taibaiella sp.]|nr:bifunctional alpha,alpha-trehalose-phosphate synthase (UDP-forming)/trehalose-phosphatase [Taibaiella sp.]
MNTRWSNTKRIINVSNRLPVKLAVVDNQLTYQQSEGGLATGLSSVFTEYKNIWLGWPGAVIAENEQVKITSDLEVKNLYPVFLTQEEINNFYEGFSNETIWPLFHYFPSYTKYNQEHWESYISVNRKFADEIILHATPNDTIWIHDYQLMLVPAMVRAALPDVTIGYFQHIPFPDYEIFRSLPWKKEILTGLLGADVIGFQTTDDERHFTSTVSRILNMDAYNSELYIDGRIVGVHAFPISIDYKKYRELAFSTAAIGHAERISKSISTKIAISIDRLDYSKGILQRLQAYRLFLDQHPEWHHKITLIHLVVPSRDTVEQYSQLKDEMNQLISDINGKYATISWQPIQHFYRSVPPEMLSALYTTADLALVTPLRDGMNLVSKEYVAGNVSSSGVLLLSDSAGAAKELTEALLLNPNDIQDFANKIYEGLNMPLEERKRRMTAMQQTIEKADIFKWAASFMKCLNDTITKQRLHVCTPVDADIVKKIERQYAAAESRLILLDYDGTLVPFFKKPEHAFPDSELLGILRQLSADAHNNVVVISGRDKPTLDKWLGHLPLDIIGEHGAWYREKGSKWLALQGINTDWKELVHKTFAEYTGSIPGSFVEEKAYSLAWHYRAADKDISDKNVPALLYELHAALASEGLDILQGNKVIEVKSNKFNKGIAAQKLMNAGSYDFVMAIGDDCTDEDMFKVLPTNSVSIKVGANISTAVYCQSCHIEVRSLLHEIYNTSAEFSGNTNVAA